MNWKVTADPKTIVSWINDTDHKRFLSNPVIKKYSTDVNYMGKGIQGKLSKYHEYSIPINDVRISGNGASGWGFCKDGENFYFAFAGRAQNGNYITQNLDEIVAILN